MRSRRLWLLLLIIVTACGQLHAVAGIAAQERSSRERHATFEMVSSSIAAASPVSLPATGASGPGDADPLLYDAILPEFRDEIYDATAGWLPRYRIDAEVMPAADDEPASIEGTVDLRYVNDTGGELDQVFFRLYPNAPAYEFGAMTISSVSGSAVAAHQSVDDTVLSIRLAQPLAAGEAVDLELAFEAIIPVRPTQTYGIFAFEPETGTVALSHWFPLLAGRDDTGWSLDPVSRNGDPIFSNTALFDVTIAVPAGWQIAATGVEIADDSVGPSDRHRFVSGPVRDFTIVTGDQFVSAEQVHDGIVVTSYFHPDDAAAGNQVLEYGVRALSLYSDLLGPYPYRNLDFVEVELYGAAGVEFPQLMFIGRTLYRTENRRNEHYLEFVTAHEVGHQWFYGLVGNNQHRHAFIDEGLVEYLCTEVYFSEIHGPEEGRRQFGLEVLLWYLGVLRTSNDMIVNQPTDDFESSSIYGAAVYAKAAIGFAEIHELIGDGAFFSGLRAYVDDHTFGVAEPGELRAALEEASGQDLTAIWQHWFEQTNGNQDFSDDDYVEILVDLGLR